MRLLFLLASLLSLTLLHSQDTLPIINEVKADVNPLDTLTFDAITAYNINFDSARNRRTFLQRGYHASEYDLSPQHASSKRIVDDSLFAGIIELFSAPATYGEDYADCFEPRFVLQFTYKGQERFRIVICQSCKFMISTFPIPAAYQSYKDTQFDDEGQQVIYRRYLKGFSEAGAKGIRELCKRLQMGYCAR